MAELTYELLNTPTGTPDSVNCQFFGAWSDMRPPATETDKNAVWSVGAAESGGLPVLRRWIPSSRSVGLLYPGPYEVSGRGTSNRVEIYTVMKATDAVTSEFVRYVPVRVGFDLIVGDNTFGDKDELMQFILSTFTEIMGAVTTGVPASTVLDAFARNVRDLGA